MQRIGIARRTLLLGAAVSIGLLVAVYAARSGGAYGATSRADAPMSVVKSARSAALGKTILVDRKGRTLYSLSAETHGRFICTTKLCLSLWTPLVVARGTTPAGARHLSTIRRPDGRAQVTYRGLPLYTFTQDSRAGDVKGNGFQDVGIWRPASPSGTVTAPSGGGGYGGLYG